MENFTKAGRSIVIYDGNAADAFPPGTSKGDRDLVMPLSSLAVQGDTLYATDAPKGRVLLYDKVSGELKREIPALLACGLVVTPDGRIWVGHERTKVSVFDSTGKHLGTPITDLQDVRALALRGDPSMWPTAEPVRCACTAVTGTPRSWSGPSASRSGRVTARRSGCRTSAAWRWMPKATCCSRIAWATARACRS